MTRRGQLSELLPGSQFRHPEVEAGDGKVNESLLDDIEGDGGAHGQLLGDGEEPADGQCGALGQGHGEGDHLPANQR